MGWAPWHGAVEHTLHRVAEERSGRPLVLLTGAADTDDERRDAVLKDLKGVVDEAVDGGVPLEQVHWWSAVDGYEAGFGFDVRTGLFDRDRNPTGIESLALAKLPRPRPDRADPGSVRRAGRAGERRRHRARVPRPAVQRRRRHPPHRRARAAVGGRPRSSPATASPRGCRRSCRRRPTAIERALATLADRPAGLGPIAEPLGLHLEGPFLSRARPRRPPGRRCSSHPRTAAGRARAASRSSPSRRSCRAPSSSTETLVDRGVVVSAGHTGASLERDGRRRRRRRLDGDAPLQRHGRLPPPGAVGARRGAARRAAPGRGHRRRRARRARRPSTWRGGCSASGSCS